MLRRCTERVLRERRARTRDEPGDARGPGAAIAPVGVTTKRASAMASAQGSDAEDGASRAPRARADLRDDRAHP